MKWFLVSFLMSLLIYAFAKKFRKYLNENKIQPQIHHPGMIIIHILVPCCIRFLWLCVMANFMCELGEAMVPRRLVKQK